MNLKVFGQPHTFPLSQGFILNDEHGKFQQLLHISILALSLNVCQHTGIYHLAQIYMSTNYACVHFLL